MKVIIAGSREFYNPNFLTEKCDKILEKVDEEIEIVSGTANGADKIGEYYAELRGYKVHKFPADWDNLGKKAGYVRNEKMAEFADALIAFWDGKSKGTKHMIDLAKKHGLKVRVIIYTNYDEAYFDEKTVREKHPSICYDCDLARAVSDGNIPKGYVGCVLRLMENTKGHEAIQEAEIVAEGWIYHKRGIFKKRSIPPSLGDGVMSNLQIITKGVKKCEEFRKK